MVAPVQLVVEVDHELIRELRSVHIDNTADADRVGWLVCASHSIGLVAHQPAVLRAMAFVPDTGVEEGAPGWLAQAAATLESVPAHERVVVAVHTAARGEAGRSARLAELRSRCEHNAAMRSAVELADFAPLVAVLDGPNDHGPTALAFEGVIPATTLRAQPVRPLRVASNPLAHALLDERTPPALAKCGYITMDQGRKAVLLTHADPAAYEVPLIGVWVALVGGPHEPLAWAGCARYLLARDVLQRATPDPHDRPFILLCVPEDPSARPEWYECVATDGADGETIELLAQGALSLASEDGAWRLSSSRYHGHARRAQPAAPVAPSPAVTSRIAPVTPLSTVVHSSLRDLSVGRRPQRPGGEDAPSTARSDHLTRPRETAAAAAADLRGAKPTDPPAHTRTPARMVLGFDGVPATATSQAGGPNADSSSPPIGAMPPSPPDQGAQDAAACGGSADAHAADGPAVRAEYSGNGATTSTAPSDVRQLQQQVAAMAEAMRTVQQQLVQLQLQIAQSTSAAARRSPPPRARGAVPPRSPAPSSSEPDRRSSLGSEAGRSDTGDFRLSSAQLERGARTPTRPAGSPAPVLGGRGGSRPGSPTTGSGHDGASGVHQPAPPPMSSRKTLEHEHDDELLRIRYVPLSELDGDEDDEFDGDTVRSSSLSPRAAQTHIAHSCPCPLPAPAIPCRTMMTGTTCGATRRARRRVVMAWALAAAHRRTAGRS